MKFEIQGADALLARFKALPKALTRPTMIRALTNAAEPMRKAAASRINRSDLNHPHLADHIIVAPAKSGHAREPAVAIGPEIDLAHRAFFLEYGTKFMAARPFLRPAFDANLSKTAQSIGQELLDGIKRGESTGTPSTGGGLL